MRYGTNGTVATADSLDDQLKQRILRNGCRWCRTKLPHAARQHVLDLCRVGGLENQHGRRQTCVTRGAECTLTSKIPIIAGGCVISYQ